MIKIISGGQTGADRAAIEWAKAHGFETGGWMPKGFRAEDQEHPDFGALYGIKCTSSAAYAPRTEMNIRDSDATLLFGDDTVSGSKLTRHLCKKHGKPYLRIPFPVDQHLVDKEITAAKNFIEEWRPKVLNVAGNRESKNPGISTFVKECLTAILLPSSSRARI